VCARSCAPKAPFAEDGMASGLLRNPKLGRVWYPPARVEIPRSVAREELVDLLYREGGPKEGLVQRADAIDTLWRGYTYLRLRAEREDSGDFATTAEQTIIGLTFELQRRASATARGWRPARSCSCAAQPGASPPTRPTVLPGPWGSRLRCWYGEPRGSLRPRRGALALTSSERPWLRP